MKTTCGVLIINEQGEWLLGHATGQKHWDILKGLLDEGEQPPDAAIREVNEESGLVLSTGQLIDYGSMPYRPEKRLHLFTVQNYSVVDTATLICTSTFAHYKTGVLMPEIDRFKWCAPDVASNYLTKNMYKTISAALQQAPL